MRQQYLSHNSESLLSLKDGEVCCKKKKCCKKFKKKGVSCKKCPKSLLGF